MGIIRKSFIAIMLCCMAVAKAAPFPSGPITLVVPYSPGGGTDILARVVGKEMATDLNVSVIIENRPGASGNIGTGLVARAAPNGQTLLFTSSGLVINPSLFKNLPFDPVKDFTPVAEVASGPSVLVVNANSGVTNMSQFIAKGKSKQALTFGSAGLGQPTHLVAEKLASAAQLNVLHIPYKGSGEAEMALAGGQIDFLIDSIPAALPFIRSQKTRALAVTGATRFPIPVLENVPTLQESGLKNFNFVTWWGILAPHGTPPDRIQLLSKSVAKAMKSADLKQRFVENGATPNFEPPERFKAYIDSELINYRKLITTLNIQAQ